MGKQVAFSFICQRRGYDDDNRTTTTKTTTCRRISGEDVENLLISQLLLYMAKKKSLVGGCEEFASIYWYKAIFSVKLGEYMRVNLAGGGWQGEMVFERRPEFSFAYLSKRMWVHQPAGGGRQRQNTEYQKHLTSKLYGNLYVNGVLLLNRNIPSPGRTQLDMEWL